MALVLLGIVVLRLWIMPIGSSFWVDEAGTFWMVKDGIPQLLHKMLEWPSPMTPFYGLVAWAAYWAGGAREYVLRLPSVLAIALSSLLLFRLSRRLFGKASAFPAAVVFICSKEVAFSSCDARPYAFLLLFTVAATLALCVWLETGAARHGAVYLGLAALMAYTHYLGSVVWCAHACYALVRLREGSRVQAKHLMVACAALGTLVAPLAPFLLRLFASRSAHNFSKTPNPEALAAALAPPVLIAAVALGVLAARIIYGPVAFRGETKRSAFVLALTLWAIPLRNRD